jgi:hypothetical protein
MYVISVGRSASVGSGIPFVFFDPFEVAGLSIRLESSSEPM